jgi:putative SOS response-associated peptidase YedK
MCTHYVSTRNHQWVKSELGVELPEAPFRDEIFPGYYAPIVYRLDGSMLKCDLARFGLVPHWARDLKIGRHTYNARCETVADKPSFRDAWHRRQFCLVLADVIFEPNYESGRAVRWGIRRQDHTPMAIAGLWDAWSDPTTGERVLSFTMITTNADDHSLMRRFHRPDDEKRTVVILNEPIGWLCDDLLDPMALLTPPTITLEAQAAGPKTAQLGLLDI